MLVILGFRYDISFLKFGKEGFWVLFFIYKFFILMIGFEEFRVVVCEYCFILVYWVILIRGLEFRVD